MLFFNQQKDQFGVWFFSIMFTLSSINKVSNRFSMLECTNWLMFLDFLLPCIICIQVEIFWSIVLKEITIWTLQRYRLKSKTFIIAAIRRDFLFKIKMGLLLHLIGRKKLLATNIWFRRIRKTHLWADLLLLCWIQQDIIPQ